MLFSEISFDFPSPLFPSNVPKERTMPTQPYDYLWFNINCQSCRKIHQPYTENCRSKRNRQVTGSCWSYCRGDLSNYWHVWSAVMIILFLNCELWTCHRSWLVTHSLIRSPVLAYYIIYIWQGPTFVSDLPTSQWTLYTTQEMRVPAAEGQGWLLLVLKLSSQGKFDLSLIKRGKHPI